MPKFDKEIFVKLHCVLTREQNKLGTQPNEEDVNRMVRDIRTSLMDATQLVYEQVIEMRHKEVWGVLGEGENRVKAYIWEYLTQGLSEHVMKGAYRDHAAFKEDYRMMMASLEAAFPAEEKTGNVFIPQQIVESLRTAMDTALASATAGKANARG